MLPDYRSIECVCHSPRCNTLALLSSGNATIYKNIQTSSLQCYSTTSGPNLTIIHGASYCVSSVSINTSATHQQPNGGSIGIYITNPKALDDQLGCTTVVGLTRDIQVTSCLCKTNLCNPPTPPTPTTTTPATTTSWASSMQISVMGSIGCILLLWAVQRLHWLSDSRGTVRFPDATLYPDENSNSSIKK